MVSIHLMRIGSALTALMCGVVSSYAAASHPEKWCSNGFDKPAELSQRGHELFLTIGGKRVETIDIENGDVRYATLMASHGMENYPQQDILILRDRVFWPCENK